MKTLAWIALFGMLDLHAQTPGRTFEVASIKARGDNVEAFPVCDGNSGLRLEPGRLTANNTTLLNMVVWAYGVGHSCFLVSEEGLVSGGPKWVLTDRFDVQATIPAGTPVYSAQQLQDGRAPEVQEMLRSMLEERFKLSVHKVMKDVAVYELTVAPNGPKLTPPRGAEPKTVGIRLVPDDKNEILVHLVGNKATLQDMTLVIEPVTHTPVLDRSGQVGEYSFDIKFAVIEPFSGPLSNLVGATSPTIFTVLEKELGLKLARGRAAVEQWVIEKAEKPSAN
jgi:uncharacterized protein (TIGR03435 family)